MRLKLYRAPGVTEAMSRIRAELGPEALILSTRRVSDGVEVTAALEPPSPGSPTAPPPAAPPADGKLNEALAFHGVPPSLGRTLAGGSLPATLRSALRFADLDLAAGARPLLLAGPPGAGKTLTAVRLATRLVMAGVTPMLITADGRRAGAVEQLAAYTRLLGIPLIVAADAVMLGRALSRRHAGAPVLIDTPGLDGFDPAQMDELAGLVAIADAAVALVLAAGMDPAESADLGATYAQRGATALVPTRLDLARRLGGVLSAAAGGRLALTEAGIGPGAADGLVAITPAWLADRLLHSAPERRP